jgi:quercetin dioxygenase-like cupin family protein
VTSMTETIGVTSHSEGQAAETGVQGGAFYERALADAAAMATERTALQTIIKAEEMVLEDSPQGRLKHLVNTYSGSREFALNIYQQTIEPGKRSGKHRHFSDEIIFILEGEGYDLHWDPTFDADDVSYSWSYPEEPKRFEWKAGDYVWIPPYAAHQHVAGDGGQVRFLSCTTRIPRALGLDGLEQLESVEES